MQFISTSCYTAHWRRAAYYSLVAYHLYNVQSGWLRLSFHVLNSLLVCLKLVCLNMTEYLYQLHEAEFGFFMLFCLLQVRSIFIITALKSQ